MQTSLTVSAIPVKATNMSESKSKNATDYHRHTDTFVVNSFKLHLHVTAFKIQLIVHTFLECITLILIYYTNYASKGMLQYIPHIKLQMDAGVSLWTKKNGLHVISLASQQYYQRYLLKVLI